MRVIAGTAKGRRLKEPPGTDIRPTTDRVKESMFNIIQFDVEGRRVLDLFAGSGQLGIEALSRGAESCVFVERDRAAAELVRRNLADTGLEGRGRVLCRDAVAVLAEPGEVFDLIFLDPPYRTPLRTRALQTIAAIDKLSENGIIVCESEEGEGLPDLPAPYVRGKEYRYGRILVTLYSKVVEA